MKIVHTDVAVIGAGSAGLGAYHAARKCGKKAVLIESGVYGTTCARVGCMPSKLLIAAADTAHHIANSDGFGVHAGGLSVDGKAVMARVRAERDRFVGFVVDDVSSFPSEDKIMGEARFVSDNVLAVGDHTEVHANAIVIATGSHAVIPDTFSQLGDRAVINDDVFEWETLPRSVVVFGPGVIGIELGQALSRLGVHVRIFGMSGSLASISDTKVKDTAKQIFQSELYLDVDARVLETTSHSDGVSVTYVNLENEKVTERFDYALIATGRAPNVKSLDLEKTTLELDKRGVPVFEPRSMQCGQSSIFLAGDADNMLPVLHEAADEGRIAGQNAASFPKVTCYRRRAPLSIVFTDPQIAVVGKRYREIKDEDIVVGSVSFDNQGRARVIRQNRGMLNIYARCGSGEVLGAEMIAPAAEHLAHLVAWAVQSRMTVAQMLDMPFYHPVLEEGLKTALRHAVSQLKQIRQDRSSKKEDGGQG